MYVLTYTSMLELCTERRTVTARQANVTCPETTTPSWSMLQTKNAAEIGGVWLWDNNIADTASQQEGEITQDI